MLDGARDADRIADVGCGTGRLTKLLNAEGGRTVVGIDPSGESIKIARGNDPTGTYHKSTLEEFSEAFPDERFDLVVANMVLMDVSNLPEFCRSLRTIAPEGRIIATLTHPVFWPLYWGYSVSEEFDYLREIIIQAPFRTRDFDYNLTTTHIHRPVSRYINEFARHGFAITRLDELRGPEEVGEFSYPRFLAAEFHLA